MKKTMGYLVSALFVVAVIAIVFRVAPIRNVVIPATKAAA